MSLLKSIRSIFSGETRNVVERDNGYIGTKKNEAFFYEECETHLKNYNDALTKNSDELALTALENITANIFNYHCALNLTYHHLQRILHENPKEKDVITPYIRENDRTMKKSLEQTDKYYDEMMRYYKETVDRIGADPELLEIIEKAEHDRDFYHDALKDYITNERGRDIEVTSSNAPAPVLNQ